jgi:hypothetical protein
MADEERTPKNAAGPFYVGLDECIACRAPEAEAPDLMAFDEAAHSCYFVRQPATDAELQQALRAIWVSCCDAVRYAGDDPLILARLDRLLEHRLEHESPPVEPGDERLGQ